MPHANFQDGDWSLEQWAFEYGLPLYDSALYRSEMQRRASQGRLVAELHLRGRMCSAPGHAITFSEESSSGGGGGNLHNL